MLGGRLRWVRPSTPMCLEVSADRLAADPEEAASIVQAVRDVWIYSRDALLAGRLDQLVLDELGLAIELGYLPLEDVLTTLEQRPPQLDVIVTGPAVPAALMAMADQITELRRLT
jgi:cob(I)alamin adenosyltransferase